jgi:hypothetical protein
LVVYAHLTEKGPCGATDDEMELQLHLAKQAASARRNGLMNKGLVRWNGEVRPTRTGAEALVWVAEDLSAWEFARLQRAQKDLCVHCGGTGYDGWTDVEGGTVVGIHVHATDDHLELTLPPWTEMVRVPFEPVEAGTLAVAAFLDEMGTLLFKCGDLLGFWCTATPKALARAPRAFRRALGRVPKHPNMGL